MRVDVEIVGRETFCGWVVSDASELIVIVLKIANAVFVMARVPYLFRCERPCGEGVAAFDELKTFLQRLIEGGVMSR